MNPLNQEPMFSQIELPTTPEEQDKLINQLLSGLVDKHFPDPQDIIPPAPAQ